MLSKKILLGAFSIVTVFFGSQPVQANTHHPYIQQMSRTYQRLTQALTSTEYNMAAPHNALSQNSQDPETALTGSGHPWSQDDSADTQQDLQAPKLEEIRSGKMITPGLAGPAIQDISGMLQELGYPVVNSEYYGREMVWQVSRFQKDNHLADVSSPYLGYIGTSTLEALEKQFRQGQYSAQLGQKLAAYARSHVSGTRWNCYRYVAYAIHANVGSFLQGMHAYMAADYLAVNQHFKEIFVSVPELTELPAGAIVVWGKGSSRSGHISIADGNGKEISDHISPQMLAHYGGAPARVFLPVGTRS